MLTFVGDIALAAAIQTDSLPELAGDVVANLEGPLIEGPLPFSDPVVFSARESIQALTKAGYTYFALANNHTMDLGDGGLRETIRMLDEFGVEHFGAGYNLAAAARPLVVESGGSSVGLLGAGWPLIGCVPAGRDHSGCAPTDQAQDVARVQEMAKQGAPPIVFAHWGYELAPFPLPGHVSYARSLVEAGAAAVVGAHAHVVQGHEVHAGRHIFYGLGNWLFDQGVFHDGRIRFPPDSRVQLAASIDVSTGTAGLSGFTRQADGTFTPRETGDPEQLSSMATLSPFRGRTVAEYAEWYRAHVPRRGLPVVEQVPGRESGVVRGWIRGRTSLARRYRAAFPRSA